jgi:hypothetical protein
MAAATRTPPASLEGATIELVEVEEEDDCATF